MEENMSAILPSGIERERKKERERKRKKERKKEKGDRERVRVQKGVKSYYMTFLSRDFLSSYDALHTENRIFIPFVHRERERERDK